MEALGREALDYIKGISERYRTGAQILQLNRTINRLDVEKDAKTGSAANGTMVETKAPYTNVMSALFPGISVTNPLVQLAKIEHDIFDSLVLGPLGKQHSWLKKQGKGYSSSFMPERVTNTYHDSGYNPKEIIANYTAWITPGSYIDPAGRDKPNMPRTAKFPANGQSIMIPLDYFGFPRIVFEASMLPNDECRVRISIDGTIVDITRNVNFVSIGGGNDYFCGNPEKNSAINSQVDNEVGRAEVKKYAISKELSDFLQILFGIINMIRLYAQGQQLYTHCMFTTDNVVAARSKLMGLQSCLQDHEITADKSSHRVIVHLAEMNPGNAAMELRRNSLNACIKNNNTVKAHIARAIIQGFYIQGEKHFVREAAEIRDYLQDILAAIDIATTQAEDLPLEGDEALDTDVYKKEILKYYAKTPINEKGRVAQSLQRLFVNCAELRDVDPIYNIRNPARGRKTFGEELTGFIAPVRGRGAARKTRKFLNLRKMKGGARFINPAHVFNDEELNGLFASETEPWDGSVVAIDEGSLLHHMRIILGLDDTPDNNAIFEDFIFRAFNHLIYICETPLDHRLLSLYSDINVIENSELEAFNIAYAGYVTNPDLLATARGRLEAARAHDPMKMLEDKEARLTIEQINAGIERLREVRGIAPGVEAPAVDMEVNAQAPPAAPAQAAPEYNNFSNDESDGVDDEERNIETEDEADKLQAQAQRAQKARKREEKIKQSPKVGSNSEAQRQKRELKSLGLRGISAKKAIQKKRGMVPQGAIEPMAPWGMRKTRKLRRNRK